MVTIENIKTKVFTLPLEGALKWGTHNILRELRHVLVECTLSDGSVGQAEAIPRPTIYGETAETVQIIARDELLPRIKGLQSSAYDLINSKMDEVKNNNTVKGAIDMALYEANAYSNHTSLAQSIGATKNKIKVSYILGISSLETSVKEATRVYEKGVRVLKIKIGKDFTGDMKRIKNFLQELPDDVEYYADANETMTEENSEERLKILKDMGFLYCEEPLPVQKIRQRSKLRTKHLIDIIGDDSCMSLEDMERELGANTIDVLNIKVARTGYTRSLAMLKMIKSKINKVMVGSQAASGLGTRFAAIFSARPEVNCPCELSFFLKLKEDILEKPIQIKDGYLDTRQFRSYFKLSC
ncbi:MAG: enolase C-terminal domain-like protein [Candidatus Roizmanbacteria bacterium]|nr:enolase C-terminal domain-like protein [Candidatus Roizmanbacteria bacterium]